MSSATRVGVTGYMVGHLRGRHGRVTYDLDVLGLDPGERAEALAFYCDRFLDG
jgi:hypothetical protein